MNLYKRCILPCILVMLAVLATAGPVFCTDQATVSRELGKILSDPEFNRLRGTLWWERVMIAIERKLFEWMSRMPSLGGIGHGTSLILAVVVVAAVIVLGIVIYKRMSRRNVERVTRAKTWFQKGEEALSGRQLIDKANETSKSGDNLNAFRLAYLAILVRMDEVGTIKFKHDKTNWEYLMQIKSGPLAEYRPKLRDITISFDNAFYGSKGAGIEEYEQARALYQEIEHTTATDVPAESGDSHGA